MSIDDMREAVRVSERVNALELTRDRLAAKSSPVRINLVLFDGGGSSASLDVAGETLRRLYGKEIRHLKAQLGELQAR